MSTSKVAVFTMDVLMGIASMAGGGAALVITGTNVLEFVHKHLDQFPKVLRVLKALATARAVLMAVAPTLYSKALDAALRGALSGLYAL